MRRLKRLSEFVLVALALFVSLLAGYLMGMRSERMRTAEFRANLLFSAYATGETKQALLLANNAVLNWLGAQSESDGKILSFQVLKVDSSPMGGLPSIVSLEVRRERSTKTVTLLDSSEGKFITVGFGK